MPIPKNVTFVTFDVYGTLIDWETGIYEAFAKEAARDGFEIDRAQLIALFHEISREIEGGSYELYAEVLRRTAIEIAKRLEWPLEPSRSGFLPDSVQRWKPFKETNTQLQKLAKKYKLGLLSNIDDKLLGQTRRHIPIDFDLVVTAQQVRSYKPEPRALHRVRAAHRRQARLGARGREPLPRRRALRQTARARDLGQPQQGDARVLAEEADAEVANLKEAAKAARRHLDGACVGRVALHRDVIVVTSQLFQAALHARARAPERGGWTQSGEPGRERPSRSTRRCCPKSSSCCPRSSSRRASRAPQRAARDARRLGPRARPAGLSRGARSAAPRAAPSACAPSPARPSASCARFDEELLIERPRPLALGSVQALPVPGRCDDRRRRARAASRRRGTPATAWRSGSPGRGVLVAGDYLSDVELPGLRAANRGWRARRRGARRRAELIPRGIPRHARAPAPARSSRAEHVVPGHGSGARSRSGALEDPRRGRRLPARAARARRRGRAAGAASLEGRERRAARAANVARLVRRRSRPRLTRRR